MRPKPYIGISGFKNRGQVTKLERKLDDSIPAYQRSKSRLMIGVLVSDKTMVGAGNRYPYRYPDPQNIAGIFSDRPNTLNLIHYATDRPERLLERLPEVRKLGGLSCNGVQLNIAWPNPDAIRAYRTQWPHDTIVIQLGSAACAKHGNDPEAVMRSVALLYGELATHVLIDLSGGTGRLLDLAFTEACLAWLDAHGPATMGAVIAGGLCAETLPSIEALVRKYRCSVDAESKLRYEDDCFSQTKALDYVRTAAPYYL